MAIQQRILAILITLLPLAGALSATDQPQGFSVAEIVLCRHEKRTLPSDSNSPIRVGDGSVIRVREQSQKIEVIGKKQGVSRLDIGSSPHLIRVLRLSTCQLYKDLETLSQNFWGPQLKVDRGQVLIAGNIYRLSDWLDFKAVANGRPYVMAATIEDRVQADIQEHIDQQLETMGRSSIQLQFNHRVEAFLPATTKKNDKELVEFLARYGVTAIESHHQISLKPMVRVQILVLEMSRSFSRELGIQWSGDYSAQLLPEFANHTTLLSKFQALEGKGKAQILAAPELLSRSGAKAEFLVGGEIPIKTYGFKNQGVHWKKHGISLTIEPQVDWNGQMSIQLTSEVSSVDKDTTVGGIPAMKSNRVQTHFDLKQSRTIALSGLIKKSESNSRQQLPFLSSIPILGVLFRSDSYLKNESELIILVTPSLVREKNG